MRPKAIFDLIVLTSLSLNLAFGIPRMVARRWAMEGTGLKAVAGEGALHAMGS